MLRIAVPNKGALSEAASAMLIEAGYRQRRAARDLTATDEPNGVQFFYLRPRDIATYVASGDLDLGITGRDLLVDSRADAAEVMGLGFGGSTFRYAAAPGTAAAVSDLQGKRIATSFTGVVAANLEASGVTATVVHLDGAVENAVGLGVADAVADVVSTGATLRQAGLEIFGEPIMTSEAILIARDGGAGGAAVDNLVRRLQGVLVARRYVMLAYDVHAEDLERACALTPGIESPTISPLQREGWVAVESMTPRGEIHRIMDDLYALGARGILVTDIHACRI
ncbi:MAG TPA: ATP phosphoribosyltransferase [Stackebrandtia sp.]|jgi:ATP phosphoribosyltransferase|uniref:ATP phosphoribosyltransferase n=1 Tax=Stackebrandtia sp. TaxID=2023065 RepID=UPI002D60C74C|nr:ATP phosphoribosyltransferase [Stackebrandtia sp.]HZE41569.1 ATP phosphoribosyltransferase [Stackebrandtia sp.]